MIFDMWNPEKIWRFTTSPVRCSHFTLGNPPGRGDISAVPMFDFFLSIVIWLMQERSEELRRHHQLDMLRSLSDQQALQVIGRFCIAEITGNSSVL